MKYAKMTTSYQGSTIKTTFCFNSIVFQCPDTVEEWQQIAIGFKAQWNFSNCLGALDGKHINNRSPTRNWINILQLQAYIFHSSNGTGLQQLQIPVC